MTIFRSSGKLRAALGVATAVAVAGGLTACGDGGSSAGLDLSSKAPTGVTITIWRSSADSPALQSLYKAWEKESGNKISFVDLPNDTAPQVVQTKWATGARPDVLEYNSTPQDMAQLNMSKNMIDLTSLPFASRRSIATLGAIDGKVYGGILGPVSVFGEFYNKDVLSKAGISAPTTADELVTACQKIKAAEPGVAPIHIGGGSQWPAMMLPGFTYMGDANADNKWGEAVAAGTTKVDDADSPLTQGLTLMTTLKKDGCLNSDSATATFNQSEDSVLNGKAGMTFLPSDQIADFVKAAGSADKASAAVGFGAFSADAGVASYAPGAFGSYFAPKTGNATKERAAADFINWAATDGYQQYVTDAQIVPTLSTASAAALSGMSGQAAALLKSPKLSPAFNLSVPGFGNFGTLAQEVLVGQTAPADAMKKFQTFVDQAIAAQK